MSGSVPTSLHKVSHFKLPKKAHHHIGMGKHGDILLHDRSSGKLCMYKYDGKCYVQKWDKQGKWVYSCKAVNRDGDLFLQEYSDKKRPTTCCSNELQEQYSVNHKGQLMDTIDGDLVYLEKYKKFFRTRYRIVVHSDNHSSAATSHGETSQEKQSLTLLPQWRNWTLCDPSVCRTQQYYVVVELNNHALDVFDLKGMFMFVCISFCDGLERPTSWSEITLCKFLHMSM